MEDKKDYCTKWFEGWWAHCCKEHDKAYEIKRPNRLKDDKELFKCVLKSKSKWLYPVNAVVASGMFIAVRIFGGRRHV